MVAIAHEHGWGTIASFPDGARFDAPHALPVVGVRGRHPCDSMADSGPLTLAVVDDDEAVRTALRRLLRAMGHDVRVFASAEEYEARAPDADCLIVDLRLPGLNGFELRERLRLRGSLIPIVFITGDGGPSPSDATAHAGTPTVAKPFSESDLIAAIVQAVSSDVSVHRVAPPPGLGYVSDQ
jgi:FixJ family two-component response regulator